MKKITALILAALCVVSLCACTETKTEDVPTSTPAPTVAPSTPTPVEIKGTIGILVSNENNSNISSILDGILDGLCNTGYEPKIMDSKGVAINDVLNMEDILKEKIVGIIYIPVASEIALDVVRLATVKEVPVVTVGRLSCGARVVSNICPDYAKLGDEAGKILLKKYSGDYAQFADVTMNSADAETEVFYKALKKTITESTKFGTYVPELGFNIPRTVEEYTKCAVRYNKRLKGVLLNNDLDAIASMRTAEEEGRNDLCFLSLYGSETIDEAIDEGKLFIYVNSNTQEMGQTAAETMVSHLSGEEVEPEIATPAELVVAPDMKKTTAETTATPAPAIETTDPGKS